MNVQPFSQPHPQESPMRYENLGPVTNPDGSPSDLTRSILAGTGRSPEAFAAGVPWDRSDEDSVNGTLDYIEYWPGICQSCWQNLYPGQYVPQEQVGMCAACGRTSMVATVHPEVAQEAAALVDRPPLCDIHVPTEEALG